MTDSHTPVPTSPAAPPPAERPAVDPPPGSQPGGQSDGQQPGGLGTRLLAGGLLLAAAAAVAVYAVSRGGEPQPEQPAPATGGHALPVDVVVIAREDVSLAPRFLARTGPSHVVEVRSRVSGTITERAFAEGAAVSSGQPLLQIDPRPFQLQLAEGQARLAAAEARRDRAGQQLARFEQLRTRLAATSGDVEEWEKEQRVAAADVELQRAQIASTRLQLDYASIAAPLTGVIGEALLDVGAYVNAASDRLAVIQQVDPLYVRYQLTERDLLLLERTRPASSGARTGPDRYRGLELAVTLADGREHPQRGRIDFVETELSASTGTITVRGAIPNPTGDLRPGQFVHVTVLGMERQGVLRVPQAAVMHSPQGSSVYVVAAGDQIEARPIELADWLGEGLWEVTSGLQPGDRVVTNRLLTLRPGAPVAPKVVTLLEASGQKGAP